MTLLNQIDHFKLNANKMTFCYNEINFKCVFFSESFILYKFFILFITNKLLDSQQVTSNKILWTDAKKIKQQK